MAPSFQSCHLTHPVHLTNSTYYEFRIVRRIVHAATFGETQQVQRLSDD